jgi:SAM-dependent methyltransferase
VALSQPNTDNSAIWEYFQNDKVYLFAGSMPRFKYLIKAAGKPRGTLLNIGCGDGAVERIAQKKGWTVVSVDPDKPSVDKLVADGIDARTGLIEQLPVCDKSVDIVVVSEVFEHLSSESIAGGLPELCRVLKNDGELIGTVPFREDLDENTVLCPGCKKVFHRWGHQQTFDESRMRELLTKHFKSITMTPRFFYNTRSTLAQLPKVIASKFGVHSGGENLFFRARNPLY